MSVTPAASISLAIDAAQQLVLASSTFTDRVEAVHVGDAAGDHFHLDTLAANTGLQDERPYALLRYASRGSNVVAEGIEVDLAVGGRLLLLFEDLSQHDDPADSYLEFCNWIGGIIDDMEQISGQEQYLAFKSEMIFGPIRTQRSKRSDTYDYWSALFLLTYGDELQ